VLIYFEVEGVTALNGTATGVPLQNLAVPVEPGNLQFVGTVGWKMT
jgi:hypothetical protein